MTNKSKMYIYAEDVMEDLGVSRAMAYKIIRIFNEELKNEGNYLTISGRIPLAYYEKKIFGKKQ